MYGFERWFIMATLIMILWQQGKYDHRITALEKSFDSVVAQMVTHE